MSSIPVIVDAKESNSIELLNITEVSEIIDVNNFSDVNNFREVQRFKTKDQDNGVVENIKLDKTNIETYMNDFNKNFYNIKFSKVILEDIYELHSKKDITNATTDFRNKFVEEHKYQNNDNDKKLVPIGMREPSSIDYSSNIINKSYGLVKSSIINTRQKEAPTSFCVGVSASPNLTLLTPDFNLVVTKKVGPLGFNKNLNLTIPGFEIRSGDIGLNNPFFDIVFSNRYYFENNCNQKDKNMIYGTPFCRYNDRCHNFIMGWHNCRKDGFSQQVFTRKTTYIPKTLLKFSNMGVKCGIGMNVSSSFTFQVSTNIPVLSIKNAIGLFDKTKKTEFENMTNITDILKKLQSTFTLQNVIQIMVSANSVTFGALDQSPYVEFIITSIKTTLDISLTNFNVGYGSDQFNIGGFNFNKEFEALEDSKTVKFSLDLITTELKIDFTIFTGTLSDLLMKLIGLSAANNMNILLNRVGIRSGMIKIILLIVYETYLKNELDVNNLANLANKTNAQKNQLKSLQSKLSELSKVMTNVTNLFTKLKNLPFGGITSVISTIIEKMEPNVELSIGACMSAFVPIPMPVACGSISLPTIDILDFLKSSITSALSLIPRIDIADPISDETINKLPRIYRQPMIDYNAALEALETALTTGIASSMVALFDRLEDKTGLGVEVSPSIDWCIPL